MVAGDLALEAISHPHRRAMLRLVLDRELPVGELAQQVGLSQPAASQHLKVLRDAGLVRGRVDGRRRLYRVDPSALERLRRDLELAPYRRVVFTYGWEDGRMGVPPESTTVEIELDGHDGQTTLRLTHHGLPPETSRITSAAGSTSSAGCGMPPATAIDPYAHLGP